MTDDIYTRLRPFTYHAEHVFAAVAEAALTELESRDKRIAELHKFEELAGEGLQAEYEVRVENERLRADVLRLEAEVNLITHKVITCGVAASHPDATLTYRGAYADKWNSGQAENVRKLRADRDRLSAALEAERDSARSLHRQVDRDAETMSRATEMIERQADCEFDLTADVEALLAARDAEISRLRADVLRLEDNANWLSVEKERLSAALEARGALLERVSAIDHVRRTARSAGEGVDSANRKLWRGDEATLFNDIVHALHPAITAALAAIAQDNTEAE